MDPRRLVEASLVFGFFVNGIVFGSILAIGAIGLSLVYGILRLSNFAHGDFLSLGAFLSFAFAVSSESSLPGIGILASLILGIFAVIDLAWPRILRPTERITAGSFALLLALVSILLFVDGPTAARTTNLELVGATLLAILGVAGIAVALDRVLWRPLRRKGATALSLIVVSIGLALIVRNALLFTYGGGIHRYLRPTLEAPTFLGAHVSYAQQFVLASAALIMLALHFFLQKTRTGKAMRALADNVELARVSGIDVDRVTIHVWIIAGALIAYAGVLLTLFQTNSLFVTMGFTLLIPLFASVILGGIGSPYGAMIGGFVVGVAMKTSILWWGSEYELASAFVILALVMFARPQGILGGRIT